MKSGPCCSTVCGAVLILIAAVVGCGGETEAPTVEEALVEPSSFAATAPADRAVPAELAVAVDLVRTWARDDGMDEETLRELFADLAERAALGGGGDDVSDHLRERNDVRWQEEESSATPL